MNIVYRRKLSKVFPDTQLVIAISNGIAKYGYQVKVEEHKESDTLYSTDDSVEVTVTANDKFGNETDYVSWVYPQLDMEDPDVFAEDYCQLVVTPINKHNVDPLVRAMENDPYLLSPEARRNGTLFLTLSTDTTSVLYLVDDPKGEEEEISIPLYEETTNEM